VGEEGGWGVRCGRGVGGWGAGGRVKRLEFREGMLKRWLKNSQPSRKRKRVERKGPVGTLTGFSGKT